MNYSEGIIKNTEFFTTSELAEKLKMNVQVITRKVQAGEIFAYKIGKDWRIPEQSVFDWLEANSNLGNKSLGDKTIKNSIKSDKPEKLPAKPSRRKYLLEYILAQFETNRDYSIEEVNGIIERYHKDTDTVREEFITEKMLEKKGDRYRRRSSYKLSG